MSGERLLSCRWFTAAQNRGRRRGTSYGRPPDNGVLAPSQDIMLLKFFSTAATVREL